MNASTGVILNRIRGTEIDEMVKKANGLGIEILGFMPEDPCVTEHDLLDIPITDIPDDSPCMKAVRDILEKQGFSMMLIAMRLKARTAELYMKIIAGLQGKWWITRL